MGADWEVSTEGRGGAGSLGNVLLCGSSGCALFWSRDIGNFGTNDAEVRGIACGFPAAGHKKTGNKAERWVLAEGDGRNSPTGIGDTAASDIYGKAIGDSFRVGGPTAYF